MPKNMRLFISFVGLVVGIFYLTRISEVKSQREILLKNFFSIDFHQQQNWNWKNQEWSFVKEFKSSIHKNAVWFILKSIDSLGNKDQASYSLMLLRKQQVTQNQLHFLEAPLAESIKFEIKKISDQAEALFFIEKKCQPDFCTEYLKVYSLFPEDVREIGNVILSASNLISCKKDKKPCFEYFGKYFLEKSKSSSQYNIKVTYAGFEEDQSGKSKAIEPEIYIFENGKYISETFKKYH